MTPFIKCEACFEILWTQHYSSDYVRIIVGHISIVTHLFLKQASFFLCSSDIGINRKNAACKWNGKNHIKIIA